MNDYEQRKQDRIDRYLEKAEKARAESSALSQQAHTMLSAIPPGQPMLPNHYSYKSDKRYRDRIDSKMRQSISADEKADYYENKAHAAQTTAQFLPTTQMPRKSCKKSWQRLKKCRQK